MERLSRVVDMCAVLQGGVCVSGVHGKEVGYRMGRSGIGRKA